MTWTDERVEALKELWAEGLSCSEIGRRLGLNKNQIIGKVHRLKLPSRPSPIKRSGTKKLAKLTVVATSRKRAKSGCCWPEGHPGTVGFRFCGEASLQGKPYCAEHYARAYVVRQSRAAA